LDIFLEIKHLLVLPRFFDTGCILRGKIAADHHQGLLRSSIG